MERWCRREKEMGKCRQKEDGDRPNRPVVTPAKTLLMAVPFKLFSCCRRLTLTMEGSEF